MFLEKFKNKRVHIQYFVGNDRVDVSGCIASEEGDFLFLCERNQMIKISSITSIYEEAGEDNRIL